MVINFHIKKVFIHRIDIFIIIQNYSQFFQDLYWKFIFTVGMKRIAINSDFRIRDANTELNFNFQFIFSIEIP